MYWHYSMVNVTFDDICQILWQLLLYNHSCVGGYLYTHLSVLLITWPSHSVACKSRRGFCSERWACNHCPGWILVWCHYCMSFTFFRLFTQAQSSLSESNQKLELLRISLEKRINELGPGSARVDLLKQELDAIGPNSYNTNKQHNSLKRAQSNSPFVKAAALTGKLEVR